ncbi:aminotransferase class I/II-fold pyridoxal phosphate-dependent enzyme [Candidatus Vidania fulgoroideae]|uniref:Aminotransferase class I/II-fold pyridoxal phosphate-dependent enzyme n=1 Tax=Candidatus Vidania fulgoroideorum TaxID=881286 RepID=A0A975ADS6_9PROT|nr:aminotransferase class I/II-fold pyridoxal phosphate-dependent enzyme [Candidatus Vidania fulgoroideae]
MIDLSIGEKKVSNYIVDIYKRKYYSIYPHVTSKSNKLMISLLIKKFPWFGNFKDRFYFTLGNRDGIYTSFYVLNRHKRRYVIIFKPYYQIYKRISLSFDKNIILICSNNIRNAFNYYYKLFPYVDIIFICNPNNFNGGFISRNDVSLILYYASRYNIGVISDECYSELCIDSNIVSPFYLSMFYSNSRFIYLNSLSKRSCLPGLRSGILVSNKETIINVINYKTISGTSLSCNNQIISLKVWSNYKHVNNLKHKYASILRSSMLILKSNNVKAKGGIFYIGIRIPKSVFKVSCFIRHMTYVYNTILSNGKLFGIPNYVRIALITGKENCISVIKNIARLINEYKKD